MFCGKFYLHGRREGLPTGLGWALILQEMGFQGIGDKIEVHFGGFCEVVKQLSVYVVGGRVGINRRGPRGQQEFNTGYSTKIQGTDKKTKQHGAT